jgi:hypothetical protein
MTFWPWPPWPPIVFDPRCPNCAGYPGPLKLHYFPALPLHLDAHNSMSGIFRPVRWTRTLDQTHARDHRLPVVARRAKRHSAGYSLAKPVGTMAAATFKCQECETEYFVLESHKAPDTEAKCVDCSTPSSQRITAFSYAMSRPGHQRPPLKLAARGVAGVAGSPGRHGATPRNLLARDRPRVASFVTFAE